VAIYISIPMLLIPQILLCGLVVSFSDLTPKSTTGNVPVIGDIIPSRWAYEAIAVTSFTDNDYEKNFFELDKQKYENQFFNIGYLYELQSQLETMADNKKRGKESDVDHIAVIRKNLPRLTAFCDMKPYQGDYSYQSLYDYMQEAEHLLAKRSNKLALQINDKMSSLIKDYKKEGVLQLKRDNYNLKLEDCVIGADQKRMVDVIDETLVPRTGLIFLTPFSTCGRAPFYASEKVIGSWHIKTLWYNISIMLLMSIVGIILLLTDCPGRYIRKDNAS
jgi:hypothetical protein